MLHAASCSVTAVLGRLSGLGWHHPPLSLLAASLFPGAGNFSCHCPWTGWAGLGRPDLAPAHFPPARGELELDQLGLERRQHRVLKTGAEQTTTTRTVIRDQDEVSFSDITGGHPCCQFGKFVYFHSFIPKFK